MPFRVADASFLQLHSLNLGLYFFGYFCPSFFFFSLLWDMDT